MAVQYMARWMKCPLPPGLDPRGLDPPPCVIQVIYNIIYVITGKGLRTAVALSTASHFLSRQDDMDVLSSETSSLSFDSSSPQSPGGGATVQHVSSAGRTPRYQRHHRAVTRGRSAHAQPSHVINIPLRYVHVHTSQYVPYPPVYKTHLFVPKLVSKAGEHLIGYEDLSFKCWIPNVLSIGQRYSFSVAITSHADCTISSTAKTRTV